MTSARVHEAETNAEKCKEWAYAKISPIQNKKHQHKNTNTATTRIKISSAGWVAAYDNK